MRPPLVGFVVLLSAQAAIAQDVFTPEQRAEIARMIQAEREAVRQQVTRSLCDELARQGETPPMCNGAPDPGPAVEIARAAPSGPSRLGKTRHVPTSPPENRFFGRVASAVIDSPVDGGRNRFEMSASNNNNRASVRLNRNRSWQEQHGGGSDKYFSTLSATFAAPIDKQSNFTNLATLDGFANSSELALRYTRMHATGATNPFGAQGALSPKLAAWFAEVGISPDVSDDEAVRKQLKEKGLTHRIPEFEALFWAPNARRWLYGASLKVGTEKFEYTVVDTTDKTSRHEEPWAVGVFAGVLPRSWRGFYLGGGLEYQETYKAATARTVCPVVPSGPVVQCVTNPYGPPTKKEKMLISLEARSVLWRVPATLKVTHDLENDETGVDMPLFLFNDPAGGYSSGVRLGWTDTDQFAFGVFFGTAFDIEPGK